jgi:2-hydroxy-3-keto-5-methylthiopentenyl-1-phosphate phosphatase
MMRIFSDFDGTIAVEDVGSQLFRMFAGAQANEIVKHYLDGSITARACLTRECGAVESATHDEVERFVDQFFLDPTFKGFVELCRVRDIPLVFGRSPVLFESSGVRTFRRRDQTCTFFSAYGC